MRLGTLCYRLYVRTDRQVSVDSIVHCRWRDCERSELPQAGGIEDHDLA